MLPFFIYFFYSVFLACERVNAFTLSQHIPVHVGLILPSVGAPYLAH